jgi:hypothetical protein
MLKILLVTLLSLLSLNASIQKVTEGYVIVQTAGDTYMGNELDQTYSLNPFLIGAGESIVIIDQGGNNTIELVEGLTITSSVVVSNELVLHLGNGASVNIRGADKFTFDVGANRVNSVTGTQQNFETFVTNTLGLESVPTQGQPAVSGGAVDAIVSGGGSINNLKITLKTTEKIAGYEVHLKFTNDTPSSASMDNSFLGTTGRTVNNLGADINSSTKEVKFGGFTFGSQEGVTGEFDVMTLKSSDSQSEITITKKSCIDKDANDIACDITISVQ